MVCSASALSDDVIYDSMVETLTGEVSECDPENNRFEIKHLLDQYFRYEEIVFNVTDKTEMYKGTDKITIEDVNVGDNATVRFYYGEDGAAKIISVIILNE